MALKDYGIHPLQIKELVVRPVLEDIGLGGETAINLVTGTAMAESHLNAIRQKLNSGVLTGTARSLWQIEPITAKDMMERVSPRNKERHTIITTKYMTGQSLNDQLLTNMALAAIICRLKYLSSPKPMCKNSASEMAVYHEVIYNAGGAAKASVNTPIFQEAINLTK